jgi:hypothetical protein
MQNIIEQVRDKILEVKTSADLDKIRLEYLGKSGFFAQTLSQMASIAPAERKEFGGKVNRAKQEVEHQIQNKQLELDNSAFEQKLQNEKLDISLPGRAKEVGKIHPISKATAELIAIFTKLGFEVASGPSIETDWYNFSALVDDDDLQCLSSEKIRKVFLQSKLESHQLGSLTKGQFCIIYSILVDEIASLVALVNHDNINEDFSFGVYDDMLHFR